MYCKKECIAMLLAGGQGSRLYDLTKQIAKPAVSFGGKYKIIDFPLSNCINSGIDTVGVLTQYQPLALNEYVANGAPWDLDRMRGGLSVLPPYQGGKHSDWYKGTANAIYQNINFIKRYNPDYVLILSGDHIYRMDYKLMLEQHKRTGAVCTVATITVPMEEASRFGICNTNPDGSIYEFEEKPKQPKNNQASMGIYIFSTKTLIEYLEADEADENSSNDFGKNIIPNLLNNGEKLYSYKFDGYWKDVGTISSLWEANMDLIGEEPILNLAEKKLRIYSKNTARAPQYVGAKAKISNSLIPEGCRIYGTVKNSILSGGVVVEEGAVVSDSVIMDDVVIKKGASVYTAIIDADSIIEEGAVVGTEGAGKDNITVIASGSVVAAKKA
ncbi:MAG: glucose-1-phosphate adenylyltransferase [Clostridia bacterium]|nr:glucose-1-phosphate adenylyltransferase [Clostridia bacterium]MBP3583389.1 glucose-1-phosphate adenylyltransferase [Clostridia bacterium]